MPKQQNDKSPKHPTMAQKTKETKTQEKPKASVSVLEKAGIAALELNGLQKVWVTSDGQAFALESDARNHAANLKDSQIITVTK